MVQCGRAFLRPGITNCGGIAAYVNENQVIILDGRFATIFNGYAQPERAGAHEEQGNEAN